MATYTIIAKSLGLIFILLSTFVITAIIPSIDSDIDTEKESIRKFEDQRTLAAIFSLQASHIANGKKLYLMEANIAGYTDQGRRRQTELRQRALNQDIKEIGNWNALFSKGEESELFQTTEEEIQQIVENEKLTIEEKIGEVENIRINTFNQASSRLAAAHEKRDEHKKKQGEIENSRLLWDRIFLCLQISGILLLSGSEIVEKLFIKNP